MSKSIPVSLRIPNEDAEFLAELQIDNAVTPSDKIRALIRDAKVRKEHVNNYACCLNHVNEALSNIKSHILHLEREQDHYSEVVHRFNDWLAEAYAFVSSFNIHPENEAADLLQFEQGIVKRIFRLVEAIGRLAMTETAPCYDKEIIIREIEPLRQISQMINFKHKKEKAYE